MSSSSARPNSPFHRVYISLGSNVDTPIMQVLSACEALKRLPNSQWVMRSPLYQSDPWGGIAQPRYINAVAAMESTLSPHALLEQLQCIERQHGRTRVGPRNGPRTLDLDLLLYGERQIDTPTLTVPHPRLIERLFILYPLQDVAGDLILPTRHAISTLLQQLPPWGIERIPETAART